MAALSRVPRLVQQTLKLSSNNIKGSLFSTANICLKNAAASDAPTHTGQVKKITLYLFLSCREVVSLQSFGRKNSPSIFLF